MSNPQEINLHGNTELHNCYVLEMTKASRGSLPVDFYDIAFHVPIISRGTLVWDITKRATEHYITKRGHPGRDKILVVIDLYGFVSKMSPNMVAVHHFDQ